MNSSIVLIEFTSSGIRGFANRMLSAYSTMDLAVSTLRFSAEYNKDKFHLVGDVTDKHCKLFDDNGGWCEYTIMILPVNGKVA